MSNTETKQPASRRRRSVPHPVAGATLFDGWQPLGVLPSLAPQVFPSLSSLRWFYREYRTELLESGAVAELAGRTLVNVAAFSAKAVEIGRRRAAGESSGPAQKRAQTKAQEEAQKQLSACSQG